MAKFGMKDYEDFLKEEERQDRLQEKLEDKRYEEACEAEANWYAWQREQEEERLREEFNRYSEYDCWVDDYYPEGEYDPDCYSDPYPDDDEQDDYYCMADLLDAFVPEREDDSSYDNFPDEDMYDVSEEDDSGCHPDSEIDELFEEEKTPEELRIIQKSIARNRHLYKLRTAKSAKKTAEFITAREIREDGKKASKLQKRLSNLVKKFFANPSDTSSIEKEIDKTFKELEKISLRMEFRKKVIDRQNKKDLIATSKKSKRKKSA